MGKLLLKCDINQSLKLAFKGYFLFFLIILAPKIENNIIIWETLQKPYKIW